VGVDAQEFDSAESEGAIGAGELDEGAAHEGWDGDGAEEGRTCW
jgi:hypothetical protein